jgi:alcohol dehydrogenase class IV
MTPFVLGRLPRIYFGPGKFLDLPRLISENALQVLILTGASSFLSTSHWKKLVESLNASPTQYFHAAVDGEPSPDLVDQIVLKFKDQQPDLVISIGGGSVMDAGKAVSAMLLKDGSVKEYLEGFENVKTHDGIKVPFIAVPTTAGTGSEAAKNAVLSRVGAEGFKRSIRHDNFVPDIAVVDPELMVSCPPPVTAACGMDAFVQLLESYVSPKSNTFTDALVMSGMEQVADGLIPAYQNGKDIKVRSRMAYGALMSGIALAHAGLGVVHGFASVLGGYFDIPHGVVCGTLIGAATRINISYLKSQNPASIFLEKYARAGAMVSKRKYHQKDMDIHLDELVACIDQWIEALGIPCLGDYGVGRKDIDRIVDNTGNKNNPVKLPKNLIKEILMERI